MANEKDPHDMDSREGWFKNILIMLIMALLCVIVLYLLKQEIPEKNKDIVVYIAGSLVTLLTIKVNFDYGSSASSARNAKRLDKEREAKDQAQAQVNDQQAQAVEQVIEKDKEKTK